MFTKMKKNQFFIKLIILLLITITITPVDIFLANQYLFRRIKFEYLLLTGFDIEQAVEDAGGWETIVVDPDQARITNLWGQEVRSDRDLLIRKKVLTSGDNSIFFKYVVIQLLDEYFLGTGEYSYSHITPVLAPLSDGAGYYYISVKGAEGFPWEITPGFRGELAEFDNFASVFSRAGFDMRSDVSDCDDGRISKNIILETGYKIPDSAYDEYADTGWSLYYMPKEWKRIDLDSASCFYSPDKTTQFLVEHSESLKPALGRWKYRLLELAYKRYEGGSFENPNRYKNVDAITESEMAEFETLLARYQNEILEGYLE